MRVSVYVYTIYGNTYAATSARLVLLRRGMRKVYARAYANHGANKWREIEDKTLDT